MNTSSMPNPARIYTSATSLLPIILKMMEDAGHITLRGGYLCATKKTGKITVIFEMGEIPSKVSDLLLTGAIEQIRILGEKPEYLSSSQQRSSKNAVFVY